MLDDATEETFVLTAHESASDDVWKSIPDTTIQHMDIRNMMNSNADAIRRLEDQLDVIFREIECLKALQSSSSQTRKSVPRIHITPTQRDILVMFFVNNRFPSHEEKVGLAHKCHMTSRQIDDWFSNRRKRQKKMKTDDVPLESMA